MIDRSLKTANILILDDIVSNIQILEGFLQLKGYSNVLGINDPRQVVEKMVQFQPDLILLDLNMPHFSGFEIIDQVKRILASNDYIPILVLTADSSEEAKLRALNAGASDFLSKPFNLLEVDLRIKNLLYTAWLYQQTKNYNKVAKQEVEEKTAQLMSKLEELRVEKEKVEASLRFRTSFINNVSHQLKTPLNSITGFSEIILSPDIDNEEKSQYQELLKLSAKKLSKIITNFVEISSIVSGDYKVDQKPFKTEELVNLLEKSIEYDVECHRVEFVIEVSDDLKGVELISDPLLIQKIVFQLIDNAVQFGNGSKVTIKIFLDNNRVMITVQDFGSGISPEMIERIFEPYLNLNHEIGNPNSGTGLGLIIAKAFCEVLNGSIWVSSAKGKGSTFTVSLPYKPSEVAQSRNMAESPFKVLVVEDEEINYMYMSIILKQNQALVSHASSGLDALKICNGSEQFDCILMDINLPGMDGYETTTQIRKIKKDIPIVAISAEYGDQYVRKAKEAGCNYVLNKPVKADDLKALIKSIRGF
ncbi:MAG: response regulator [Bacteroidales bacterium]|nr:response regulator [Bacteroidales bacterium]